MKYNKKIILLIICIIILGAIMGYISIKNNFYYNDKKSTISHAMRLYDTSNKELAVQMSDYIFVAKINSILKTDYRNPIETETSNNQKIIIKTPYTIYEITVLENLKGNLIKNTPIEFVQYGGINEDGKSYTLLDNTPLLNVGEYYLLLVETLPVTKEIEISDKNLMIPLGNNYSSKIELINEYKELILKNTSNTTQTLSKYDINYIH